MVSINGDYAKLRPSASIAMMDKARTLKAQGVDVTVVVPIPFYDRQVKVSRWEYEGVQVQYIRFFKFHVGSNSIFTGKCMSIRMPPEIFGRQCRKTS
mgnify:CR=1 FL=1